MKQVWKKRAVVVSVLLLVCAAVYLNWRYTGGVAVLRGNLAPDTGITKPGAFDKSLHHFKGEAICFDSEEAAEEAILAGKVHDGHVVVIRYEGPKGGPGMREMYKAMKYLYGRGLAKTTALITDGRFSGTNNGCFVGHISPEAAEGGPIAIVHDGDLVEIDVDSKKLELLVPQEEIEARLKQWKRPEPKFKKGWLGLYCKLAASGDFETITFEDEPERQPGFLIKASEVEFLSPRKVEETAQELEDESVREVAA